MGGAWAEGKGAKMTFSNDKLRLNQARIPISAGDTMSQQRTRHTLRSLAKAQAESIMLRFSDQAELVHLAGARGFDDNIEWTIPLASDPRFADVMVNTVRAPTRNRHFRASAGTITPMAASAGNITISSTDVMNTDVVDSLATLLERMPLPPPGVQFENDQMANDSPVRVLLVSAEQYTSFLQSTNFRTLQANAMARAQMAKNHPVFMGDALLWRGILILKMPKPIRFFASNALNWCPSTTSNAETTTDIVPAAFSTTYAVDRAILLGGQALAEGFGKAMQSGASFFWSEKELDHGDKMEYLIGEVAGRSKIQFLVDFGDTQQYTDYGVIAIDTAVRLAGI
jgi:N4-gp56 family major capsid protein